MKRVILARMFAVGNEEKTKVTSTSGVLECVDGGFRHIKDLSFLPSFRACQSQDFLFGLIILVIKDAHHDSKGVMYEPTLSSERK